MGHTSKGHAKRKPCLIGVETGTSSPEPGAVLLFTK
jgi:hypothetical protein